MTTQGSILLAELVEKGADTDLLREMIQFVSERTMEMDTESSFAAAYEQRFPERPTVATARASGCGRSAGRVDLKIPKLRKGLPLAGTAGVRGKSSIEASRRQEGVNATYVGKLLSLASLAPDLTKASLDGRQPPLLMVKRIRTIVIPVAWNAQRRLFAQFNG
jgi:hypothetical protein